MQGPPGGNSLDGLRFSQSLLSIRHRGGLQASEEINFGDLCLRLQLDLARLGQRRPILVGGNFYLDFSMGAAIHDPRGAAGRFRLKTNAANGGRILT